MQLGIAWGMNCTYLVRHGETEWSLSGKYTGRTDIALTARGGEMAKEIGQRLRETPFCHVLTSPMQRAQQSCAMAELAVAAVIDPDLAEWDYGDYEGRTEEEILATQPGWNLFRDGAPNGESPAQVSERADRVIARVRQIEDGVVLFSHGHFGRVLGARWIGLEVREAQHLLLSTASLSVLCHEPDGSKPPAIALWNVASHAAYDLALPQGAGETRRAQQPAIETWENEGGEPAGKPAPVPLVQD